MMPSGKIVAVVTTYAIQEIELYKETLSLKHNPGKHTMSPGHEYATCPFCICALGVDGGNILQERKGA